MFQNLGIKSLCLIIASLLWLQAAATTDVEEILRLPVRVVGLTDSLTVVGSRLPDTISSVTCDTSPTESWMRPL